MSSTGDDGLRRALEAAGIPLAIFDGEGHAISANPTFAALFGTRAESIVGRHLVGLCRTEEVPAATSALVRIVGGVSEAEVFEITPPDESPGHSVRLTLTVSPARRREERVIFCIGSSDQSDPAPEPSPPASARAFPITHLATLTESIERAIEESASSGYPFALLRCAFGSRSIRDSHERGRTDEEWIRIAVARINQRLRTTDSVVIDDSGSIHVVAEALGDAQDAAGVAYRLLSTMVEPVAVQGEKHFVHLTIGIAIGDGSSRMPDVIEAAVGALGNALDVGLGGFSIIDLRNDTPL